MDDTFNILDTPPGLSLIDTFSFINQSSADITDLPTGFHSIIIEVDQIFTYDAAADIVYGYVSDDNGSSWLNSGEYSNLAVGSGTTKPDGKLNSNINFMEMLGVAPLQIHPDGGGATLRLRIINKDDVTIGDGVTRIFAEILSSLDDATIPNITALNGFLIDAVDINAIRFIMQSTSNLDCKGRVYGVN